MRKQTKRMLTLLFALSVIFSARGMISAHQVQTSEEVGAKKPDESTKQQGKSDKNPKEAQKLFKQGEDYEREHRWQDAIFAYQQAVQIKPDFAYAYHNLGWCHFAKAKFEDALKAHQQALHYAEVKSFRLKLKAAQAHYAIGCDYSGLRRYDEAIASLLQAFKSDSDYGDAIYEIGRIRIAQGNRDETLKIASKLPEYYREALMIELSYARPGSRRDSDAGPKSDSGSPQVVQPPSNSDPGSTRPTPSSALPVILYKEKARYTDAARSKGIKGTIILSVIFYDDGSLGSIRVIKGLPYGLTSQAIIAACKIRFQPAIKNGKPVPVRGNLEFTFSLY